MGKPRKLPMEKRETKLQRSITFSKRREGLFKKSAELAMLCDAKVAMFMNTPDSLRLKVHSFGHPSVDAILDAFLGNTSVTDPVDDDATKQLAVSRSEEIRSLEREVGEIMKVKMKPEKVAGGFAWDLGVFEKSKSTEGLSSLVKILENFMLEARNRISTSASGSSSSSVNKSESTSFDDQFIYDVSDTALMCLQSAGISPLSISPSSDMENKQTAPDLDSGFGSKDGNALSAHNNTGFNKATSCFPTGNSEVHNAHSHLESASYLDYGGDWSCNQTTDSCLIINDSAGPEAPLFSEPISVTDSLEKEVDYGTSLVPVPVKDHNDYSSLYDQILDYTLPDVNLEHDWKDIPPLVITDSSSGSAYNSNLIDGWFLDIEDHNFTVDDQTCQQDFLHQVSSQVELKNKHVPFDPTPETSYYYPGEDAIHESFCDQEDDFGMKIDTKFGTSFLDNYVAAAEAWNEDGMMIPEPLACCYCSVSEIRPCYYCQARESELTSFH